MYSRTNRCYNETSSRTIYVRSSILHCTRFRTHNFRSAAPKYAPISVISIVHVETKSLTVNFQLSLCLWALLCSARVNNEKTIQGGLSKSLPTARGTFENVRESVIRCLHAGVDPGGGRFECLSWVVTWETVRYWTVCYNWERLWYIYCANFK